jgi:hypothetical protein
MNGDEQVGNGGTGCQVRPKSIFFVFFFFLTYFLILTATDAVPNGREHPNVDEWRRTGWGSEVRAARCTRAMAPTANNDNASATTNDDDAFGEGNSKVRTA